MFELLAMQKLHIVIPLSKKSSRGDQIDNAKYFAQLGVSSYIEEDDYSWLNLKNLIASTLTNKHTILSRMQNLEFSHATTNVINVIDDVALRF